MKKFIFLLGRPDQTPTGHLLPKAGGTLTNTVTIDQDTDAKGLYIDSEATTQPGIDIAMVDATKTAITTNGLIIAKAYTADGNAGLTGTATVRDSGGAADCNLVYTGGILTSTTCTWA